MIKEILKQAWDNETLAHAHILIGSIETSKKELNSFWESVVDASLSSPEKVEFHFDSLGVAESRLLKTSQAGRSLVGGHRFFIISFDEITIAAQNALLKVLEEPASQAIFFILTNTLEKLLPTVISRCQVIKQLPSETDVSLTKLVDEFIRSSSGQRLDLIEKYFNNKGDDSRINWRNFLDILEIRVNPLTAEKVWQNRRWLDLSGFPLSFITTHLAISLPIMLK